MKVSRHGTKRRRNQESICYLVISQRFHAMDRCTGDPGISDFPDSAYRNCVPGTYLFRTVGMEILRPDGPGIWFTDSGYHTIQDFFIRHYAEIRTEITHLLSHQHVRFRSTRRRHDERRITIILLSTNTTRGILVTGICLLYVIP